MNKPLFSAIYILSLLTAGLTIHQAFAQRSPAIEPITEVSIEENRPVVKNGQPERGFDFSDTKGERIPANIVSKAKEPSTPYSYIGPLIFLVALPFALWIVISKKMKNSETSEKHAYYPKTFQFKPYKTEYQEQDVDDEDHNIPKAS
ncbi:MAG: hypothetical protein Q7U04_15070 [Bacteriovorax sp.]|nr:hypothetical protein [Bacteriovorax sp.]